MDKKIDSIREGLRVCSEWKCDVHGDARKDCARCPYRNPADPAGMNCGEHLMRDARVLIDEQKDRIAKLETDLTILRGELIEYELKR